ERCDAPAVEDRLGRSGRRCCPERHHLRLPGPHVPPSVAPAAATPAPATQSELPAPVRPAFTVPTPHPLTGERSVVQWAPVERPIAAHAKPSPRAAVVARVGRSTPEQTANILLVLARAHDESG